MLLTPKKHIKKQVEHAQAEINRHIQIEHYSYILHQQFIQMFASQASFNTVLKEANRLEQQGILLSELNDANFKGLI
ncbi:TPA: hypothetical protein ACFP4Y_001293 [Neisseria bacilliformis]|uniref:hypothetical protein n=1 Tax=Neisseria bacilliformis TaxID=267212 RepID=UPI00128B1188|nr:hypothetical protein [Neisseria bacilliformis]